MFKAKPIEINTEEVAIAHLRTLDARQYKRFIQAIESYREGDRHLVQCNKPTGDDKIIDEVEKAYIETEGK